MSSTSARIRGRAPAAAVSRSKAARVLLSRLGRITGTSRKPAGKRSRFFFHAGDAHQAHRLLGQQVAVPWPPGIAFRRLVGEHHVHLVRVQRHQQIALRARADDDFHLRHVQRGPQELEQEVPRQRGHRADAQDLPAAVRAVLHHVHQLLAGACDLLGVVERQPSGLGELQAAAPALEQRVAEAFLKLLELEAQRRRREVQLFRRARQVQLAGDEAEIAEVVVVQEGHECFSKT